MTSDFHSIVDMEENNRVNYGQNVIIESHVWVGISVMILKASIDCGSIIGIRLLIINSIAPFSLAAGLPAKSVKSSIRWERMGRKECLKQIKTMRQNKHPDKVEYNIERFDKGLEDQR